MHGEKQKHFQVFKSEGGIHANGHEIIKHIFLQEAGMRERLGAQMDGHDNQDRTRDIVK